MTHEKNHFFNKLQYLNLEKAELERKWRVHQEEQEEMQRRWRIFEEEASKQAPSSVVAAASGPSAGGAGGGGGSHVVATDQTYLEILKTEGSETWKYFLMNVSGIQTELLDTGISADWSLTFYPAPVQKKGYMVVFYFDTDYTAIFINTVGTLLASFTSDDGWDGGAMDGRFLVFHYPVSGGRNLVLFDGDDYIETLYTDVNDINLGGGWDYTTSDSQIAARLYYDNGDEELRLLSMTGDSVIYLKESGSNIQAELSVYSFGNFAVLVLYDNETDFYTSLKIFSTAGVLLQNVDLTSMSLPNQNFNFYGTNKMEVVFYTNSSDDDFQIYNFNGNDLLFIHDSQPRGNFTDFNTLENNLYPYNHNRFNPDSVFNILYQYSGYDGFSRFSYMKITWLFDGDTSYGEYIFNNTGTPDKGINPFSTSPTSESIIIPIDLLDGYFSFLILLPSGTFNIIQAVLATEMDNFGSYDIFNVGNKVCISYNETGNTTKKYRLYSPTGELLTSVQTTVNSYSNAEFDTMYIYQYDEANERLWYFNNTVSSFTELTPAPINFNDDSPFYETEDGLSTGTMYLMDSTVPSVRILQKDSISDNIILPTGSGSSNVVIGKSYFIFYYINDDNFVVINLYDFLGTLVNSVVTEFNDVWSYAVIEDRFVFTFVSSSTYTTYMITPSTLETNVAENVDQFVRMVNDFAYYDD